MLTLTRSTGRHGQRPMCQRIKTFFLRFGLSKQIDTREIHKRKARINAHGGKQTHGVNLWETCSPVVNWFSNSLCLIMSLMFKWETRQIDSSLRFRKRTRNVTCSCSFHSESLFQVCTARPIVLS
jgi:hypothetical protein